MNDASTTDFSSLGDVEVTLILADSAQAIDGKLYLLGGGWTFTGPGPTPAALAGLVHVPWSRTNTKLAVRFELVDADGGPVRFLDGDGNGAEVAIDMELEVGRAPGSPEGMVQNTPFAINLSPLPFTPGQSYEWRCSVDGVPRTGRQFYVRAG